MNHTRGNKNDNKWPILTFHPNLRLYTKTCPFSLSLSLSLCTITFRGPPQGSQWGPAFFKVGTTSLTYIFANSSIRVISLRYFLSNTSDMRKIYLIGLIWRHVSRAWSIFWKLDRTDTAYNFIVKFVSVSVNVKYSFGPHAMSIIRINQPCIAVGLRLSEECGIPTGSG
jgi:hypothetical protein